MNTVFIVPTGIGCSIGGHAGDATPAFKLIASLSDIAITHPNVVNASDINEMPLNTWYVEGSILDRFLEGRIGLRKPKSNKILLVVNKPLRSETANAVNAARYTIGCDINIVILEKELRMIGTISDKGATGKVSGVDELCEQVSSYKYDALAVATHVEVDKEVIINYLKNGGINPWGGVEAFASRCITNIIDKPTAHAPIEIDDPDLKYYNEVVNARMAAEIISQCYIHSVFKGLHKAPRIDNGGLLGNEVDCLVTPMDCWGNPHETCKEAGIPMIAVRSNRPIVKHYPPSYPHNYIIVENYLEAAGYVQLLKEGMTLESISGN